MPEPQCAPWARPRRAAAIPLNLARLRNCRLRCALPGLNASYRIGKSIGQGGSGAASSPGSRGSEASQLSQSTSNPGRMRQMRRGALHPWPHSLRGQGRKQAAKHDSRSHFPLWPRRRAPSRTDVASQRCKLHCGTKATSTITTRELELYAAASAPIASCRSLSPGGAAKPETPTPGEARALPRKRMSQARAPAKPPPQPRERLRRRQEKPDRHHDARLCRHTSTTRDTNTIACMHMCKHLCAPALERSSENVETRCSMAVPRGPLSFNLPCVAGVRNQPRKPFQPAERGMGSTSDDCATPLPRASASTEQGVEARLGQTLVNNSTDPKRDGVMQPKRMGERHTKQTIKSSKHKKHA